MRRLRDLLLRPPADAAGGSVAYDEQDRNPAVEVGDSTAQGGQDRNAAVGVDDLGTQGERVGDTATEMGVPDRSSGLPVGADRPDRLTATTLRDGTPVVVLAPDDRALLAGAAVAARLPRTRRAATVIAVWDPTATPADEADRPCTGAARRGRACAEACGVQATAVGRTVHVALPDDDVAAVAAIQRLQVADGLGAMVVVIAGPWGAPFLPVLEQAGVVHADGSPATLRASALTLDRHGVAVVPVPRPTGPVARALLRGGWLGRSQVRVEDPKDGWDEDRRPGESGQALLLILLALLVAAILAVVLGGVASAMGSKQERQRAVDVAALAAADRMRADWPRRAGSPARLSAADYRARAVAAARKSASANGLDAIEVRFPDPQAGEAGPLSVEVHAAGARRLAGIRLATTVDATAELSPPAAAVVPASSGGEYAGPLSYRDGKPMRPDVAMAYDRMNAAATRAGHPLRVTSGYRSNAEQARLFAAHPDPKWVARPGTSLHRLGTELDLGPASAYGWLAANAGRFGFTKRYSWEPWHFGYVRSPGSTYVAEQDHNPKTSSSTGAIPPWTPQIYRATIRAASIRYSVSAALLAAQLRQESGFNPHARSGVGAQGIAQFMPATAAAVGLRDPFDPDQAIPAQAKLMAGLLRRFGSVQLALAAYNAGEGAVGSCQCVPPYPETRHYVAAIIALMRGYDPAGALADAFTIRLTA